LKETLKAAGIYGTVLCVVIFSGLFIAGTNVLKAFINDVDIVTVGTPFLRIVLVSCMTYGVTFLFTNLFQAAGLAKPVLAMSLTLVYIFLPVLLLANYTLGINGFAWALPISDILTMALGIILYRFYKKHIYTANAS
jgi:Na+-driven multidrug efflux pump